jgi:hypothetical protein
MANRTSEEMRLYQQARRARLKAEAEAAGMHLARPMPKDHPLVETRVQPATGRALTIAPRPLQGDILPPPRSMIADGGAPPRRYAADASIAEATAMIRAYAAEQARLNVETARRLEALERYVGEQERDKAAKASGVAKWAEARRLWFNMLRP